MLRRPAREPAANSSDASAETVEAPEEFVPLVREIKFRTPNYTDVGGIKLRENVPSGYHLDTSPNGREMFVEDDPEGYTNVITIDGRKFMQNPPSGYIATSTDEGIKYFKKSE